MNIMRKSSFGENNDLWLEKKLAKLRFNKISAQLKAVRPLEQIADLGSGYYGQALLEAVILFPSLVNAVGVDLSVDEKAGNPKIKLITADLNNALPLENDAFDAVVSTAVIEHLREPELIIKETHRILKPGGSFLLTTPSRLNKKIVEFLAFKLGWLDQTEIADHKNYFTAAELKSLLVRAGFKNIKIKFFQFGLNILAVCQK